jgi:hypothetical protein
MTKQRPSSSEHPFRRTGGTVPKLGLAQSFWALSQRKIPNERALEGACLDGFEYVEVGPGEVQQQAVTYGIAFLLETHRGRLTQDLFRMTELLTLVPQTMITLDVSHYMTRRKTNLTGSSI